MADDKPKQISVVFYRTAAGTEVVREWLLGLDAEDRQAMGLDLMRVQYRWPVGMPLCRPLKGGLWEVRTTLPSRRIARTLFCAHADALVVLSGFIKKPRKRLTMSWRSLAVACASFWIEE